MATTASLYWKLNFSQGPDRSFEDQDQMYNHCRDFFIEEIAKRAAWKAREERWHDLVRFTLACEEFMHSFDEKFHREIIHNILHLEIPDGLNPIQVTGLAYRKN
jgi:hypothetical protein